MATKKFPNQSLHTITLNGAANLTAGGHTESSGTMPLFLNKNDKMGGVRLTTDTADPIELLPPAQPHLRRKTERTPHRHRSLKSLI